MQQSSVQTDIVYDEKSTTDSFDIKRLNDYIHVQRAVINTLTDEGYFKSPQNVIANKNTGMRIEITKSGVKETFGSGSRFQTLPRKTKILKLSTTRNIPDLIRTATPTMNNINVANYHEGKTVRYAYFENEIYVTENGTQQKYIVNLSIRKSRQKICSGCIRWK